MKFNDRQIAESIVATHPDNYLEKRQNSRFDNEKSFITQIVEEIGAQKDRIGKHHVFWKDKPKPRVYWYDPDKKVGDAVSVGSSSHCQLSLTP